MKVVPPGGPVDTYEYRKAAGDLPLPGYRLLGPLGHGGFGEVWECEAPGGLHKAVKFVFDDSDDVSTPGGDQSLRQEFEAFGQIKAIRHPFLLTLERVERIGRELIMVMELADRSLQNRFDECRAEGLVGIPRDELLAYFADAAEALDLLSNKHGLQHLDVKPANLFLVGTHVKVGDFGLLRPQEAAKAGGLARGLTPKYVAPEVLNGRVDPRSDQYSLALVYQELLTGTFPYPGRSAQQIMLQHATAEPDLSGLPPADRKVILRALAKDPARRYPSCVALVESLLDPTGVQAVSETWRDVSGSSMALRRARMTRASDSAVGGSGMTLHPSARGGHPTPPDDVFAWPGQPQHPGPTPQPYAPPGGYQHPPGHPPDPYPPPGYPPQPYPPGHHPAPSGYAPPGSYPPPGYGPPPGSYPPPGYGPPPGHGYPPPGYGPPPGGYPPPSGYYPPPGGYPTPPGGPPHPAPADQTHPRPPASGLVTPGSRLVTPRRPQQPVRDDDRDEPIALSSAAPPPRGPHPPYHAPAPGQPATGYGPPQWGRPAVRLPRIYSVVPVSVLMGGWADMTYHPTAYELADAVVRAAVPDGEKVPAAGDPTRTPDGGWACRFPVKAAGGMLPLKLAAFQEEWQVEVDWPDPATAVFRRLQSQGFLGKLSGKQQAGVEVVVTLPPAGAAVGVATVTGRVFGPTDPTFARNAGQSLPRMVEDVRKHLQNQAERRTAVRLPADFPMEVFPVTGDGEVLPAVPARARDVSAGGVCFAASAPVPTGHVYVSFVGVGAAAGWAILTRLTRAQLDGTAQVVGGRYRTDV